MSVRVIGGMYGGRKLDTPPGNKTHPMGERIRNAIFNSLGEKLQGATVLDAFAGTGAVGIEALSRGAKHVTFVEKDVIAQKCIQKNLDTLKITNGTVVRAAVAAWLNTGSGALFDIIFADPPYDNTQLAIIEKVVQVIKPAGVLVLSWPEAQAAPVVSERLVIIFNRVYAGARIVMYKLVK